tara:strand:+ start:15 stop:1163 length:1149 start_codon:yes stop_codon:yes gene_type:complete
MQISSDRILTTHTGSLPRPDDLLELLVARDQSEPYDQSAFDERLKAAVDAIVQKQITAGIDIVNDGEMSKIGYGAYVKERLTGYDGEEAPRIHASDLDEFPVYFRRLYGPEGFDKMTRPLCTGPIEYVDRAAVMTDLENLKTASQGSEVSDRFLNSATPGLVSLWLGNAYYKSHEEYVWAIAHAMKQEYEAIVEAGFILQFDSPDLGMGRHMQFASLELNEFRKNIELHIEALNHATRDLPADSMHLHLCWGNYDGPHHHDVELKDIVDIVLKARPAGITFEGANARHEHEWKIWRDIDVPDEKILFPGVINSVSNFIEHPELVADRICRYADIVGRERVIACTDCGMSTQAGHTKVDPDIGWAKYASMAEGAALATERLWS